MLWTAVFYLCLFKVLQCRVESERTRIEFERTITKFNHPLYLASVVIVVIRVPFPFPSSSHHRHPPVYLQLTRQKFLLLLYPPTYYVFEQRQSCKYSALTINSIKSWLQSKVKNPFLHSVGVSCLVVVEKL